MNVNLIVIAVLALSLMAGGTKILMTQKEVGVLRGEKKALTLELKQAEDKIKGLTVTLTAAQKEAKTAEKKAKAVQKEADDCANDYAAACALNDTIIARYSAFYKKTTGKELRAKELRISRRGK